MLLAESFAVYHSLRHVARADAGDNAPRFLVLSWPARHTSALCGLERLNDYV